MKLSSDAAVLRITYEGITNWVSLTDFDKKSIQSLPTICRQTIPAVTADPVNGIGAEAEVPGANISTISVQRLIIAVQAATYYTSIDRTIDVGMMNYANVLVNFKVEWEAYQMLRDEDEPKVPKVNDRDNDRKIIRWAPIFSDYLSRCYGAKGPLRYIIRDEVAVPAEADDPLGANEYYGASGSLLEELVTRLPHTGAIYRNDNATVYIKIEEAVRGTSCESTIKPFARVKNGRGAYEALIANHAGDEKYRNISKKRLKYLQSVKWTGRSYPLENHVNQHRTCYDDLRDCAIHITVSVPTQEQRVEYLIDSITCGDATLQAAIGLVRADTNNMRSNFDTTASSLIEVDPYKRSTKGNKPGSREANVSAISFHGGRGETGVDLRWHPTEDFKALPDDQREELNEWLHNTPEGNKVRDANLKKKKTSGKRKSEEKDKKKSGKSEAAWKKVLKKKMKTDKGVASVMSVLADVEKTNSTFASALKEAADQNEGETQVSSVDADSNLAKATPSTQIKLNAIMKNGNKKGNK